MPAGSVRVQCLNLPDGFAEHMRIRRAFPFGQGDAFGMHTVTLEHIE